MIEIIKEELSKYKDKDVEILINEGRSKKRKEKCKIKKLYNRTFIIEINGINNSFSYSDVITKTIIMKLL